LNPGKAISDIKESTQS